MQPNFIYLGAGSGDAQRAVRTGAPVATERGWGEAKWKVRGWGKKRV